ncbi:50S ribosomal protein L10 [Acidaminobacterium chupaoyuni]
MPNAKVLSEKQAIVAELAEKMQNAVSGVFVDYKGITVEDDTKLRSDLRKAGVEYSVVKNTLTRFAANQIGFEALDPILNGTTALALSMDDATAPARLIHEFAKKNDKIFNIKAGFIEGRVVDVAEVEALAAIPPKDILLSTVLGTMIAPISAFARVIQAIADKQSEGEAAPAEAPVEA